MFDFQFLQNPLSKKWVILAPRRAKRPDVAKGMEPVCPFCVGREGEEKEVYRVSGNSQSSVLGSQLSDNGQSVISQPVADQQKTDKLESENRQPKTDNWLVRVLNNKFPFAPIHEIIIHSPDHNKNFDKLPLEQVQLIVQTYKNRYLEHQNKGQVYIFHNRGEKGGESLPHPHTQIAVFPFEVKSDTPRLDPSASANSGPRPMEVNSKNSQSSVLGSQLSDNSQSVVGQSVTDQQTTGEPISENRQPKTDNREQIETVQTKHFYLFCPLTSQWPDEVWIAPKKRGRSFGEITDEEILDFSFAILRLIQIFDLRHGNDFPFNFYIYPGGDWYLRLIPRLKVIGGFELSTGIFVNTQNPKETIAFIKEHFEQPDFEKIKKEHRAEYGKTA